MKQDHSKAYGKKCKLDGKGKAKMKAKVKDMERTISKEKVTITEHMTDLRATVKQAKVIAKAMEQVIADPAHYPQLVILVGIKKGHQKEAERKQAEFPHMVNQMDQNYSLANRPMA